MCVCVCHLGKYKDKKYAFLLEGIIMAEKPGAQTEATERKHMPEMSHAQD